MDDLGVPTGKLHILGAHLLFLGLQTSELWTWVALCPCEVKSLGDKDDTITPEPCSPEAWNNG